MYNSRSGAAAAPDLSQRSVRPDAGLLAARAAHETQHQRNPLSAPQSGQGLAGLLGYSGLNMEAAQKGVVNVCLVCVVCMRI